MEVKEREFKKDDGSMGIIRSMYSEDLEYKDAPLWHHIRGLSYTRTGYGKKIPSRKKVKFQGRWHRVYCHIISNCGSNYILSKGGRIYID